MRVGACAVCRTDLHVVEGELPDPKLPLVPGHQIVGTVERVGEGVERLRGRRAGRACRGSAARTAPARTAASGRENLCDAPTFTGYQRDGGYAEYAVARADFVLPTAGRTTRTLQAAPLLCAGLIGYRALRLAEVEALEGAAAAGPVRVRLLGAHRDPGRAAPRPRGVRVHARRGRPVASRSSWVRHGRAAPTSLPPVELDSAIIFAPAGTLVPRALRAVRKGGVVVCAGIHMTPIPELAYDLLWGERVLRSVANLTRADGREFLELAPRMPVQTEVEEFPLEEANEALARLKSGELRGTAVLVPG